MFLCALKGEPIEVMKANFKELSALCGEFGFQLEIPSYRLAKLETTIEAAAADARGRIGALEEKAKQHECAIAVLQSELRQLSTDFGRLAGEVCALRSLSGEVSALTTQTAGELSEPLAQQLSIEFDELRRDISILKAQIAAGLGEPVAQQLSTKFDELRREVSALWRFPAAPPLDSRIVSDFPVIFAEFRGKQFSLLWRGGRCGFTAKEFHRRCDGHANTLTVILDTKGNVFGGFTPVEWGSGNGRWKADDSQKSFLFTLKNPHNIPARRFALKAEEKWRAIWCDSGRGPCFGGEFFHCGWCDIAVSDNCNAGTRSSTSLGFSYTNDTGLDKKIVFTGSFHFQVSEIEVFRITG
jgi:hypothetical protein